MGRTPLLEELSNDDVGHLSLRGLLWICSVGLGMIDNMQHSHSTYFTPGLSEVKRGAIAPKLRIMDAEMLDISIGTGLCRARVDAE